MCLKNAYQVELDGKDPVYTKGNPFRVYVGRDGYSVLTVTYTFTETYVQNALDGRQISKVEFDRN